MYSSIGDLPTIVGEGIAVEIEGLDHLGNEGTYLSGVLPIEHFEGW